MVWSVTPKCTGKALDEHPAFAPGEVEDLGLSEGLGHGSRAFASLSFAPRLSGGKAAPARDSDRWGPATVRKASDSTLKSLSNSRIEHKRKNSDFIAQSLAHQSVARDHGEETVRQETASDIVDMFVIGGGINGCGIARDAAGRGLSVVLAEMNDLASATSSASTKLFHGGLRYLEYLRVPPGARGADRARDAAPRDAAHQLADALRAALSGDMRFEANADVPLLPP